MRFELDSYHRDVPDNDLIADLQRVASAYGTPSVSWEQYAADGAFGCETLRRRFGSWNNALQRAGLELGKRWRIPNEELFANLEAIWRGLGRQPRRADLDSILSRVSRSVYEQRFGSWRRGLEAFVSWANQEERSESAPPIGASGHRTGRQPSLRLRFHVMQRDDFRCRHCGRAPATSPGLHLHVDHIRPWAAGGETLLENLQTLCEDCNQGKGRELEERT